MRESAVIRHALLQRLILKNTSFFNRFIIQGKSPLDLNTLKANETLRDGIQLNTVTLEIFSGSCSSVCQSGLR